ncbi:4Fe-4S binding protein [Methanoregula sp.]|uniref:4Fe-4S binding protein n=1 Tax=Methanoregula sp. TaxID=2052170 RepID=UPI002371CA03|nr:4Fe-4S binding protein [Methanoregula sp.]MDD1685720.1 4Fe-4S binding protein [Methanoregula sp.]
MKITKSIRKYIATGLVTAGMVYPACAAVCPKGIGGCTSPGRCFLFTDADGNSLCDYTAGSGSSAAGPSGSGQSPPTNAVDTTTATTTPTTVQNSTGFGLFDSLSTPVMIAGAILFALISAVLYFSIRKGIGGIKIDKTAPALALSALFALGISLMATCILSGSEAAGMIFALIYLVAGTLLAAYLWHAGVMTRRIILVLAAESTLTGFVFLAPIMPLEFIGIINTITGATALSPAIIILCAVIVITLIVGRTFCGHICPVGSIQELAYAVPAKKIELASTRSMEMIRLAVLAATILAAVCLVDLMAYTGLYELFSLTVSAALVVAAALILLSVFVYRPVCRMICPFGALFSLMAGFSFLKLRRTETCVLCKKCETVCPAHAAGRDDTKRECYLCGRCTDACHVRGAIRYRH